VENEQLHLRRARGDVLPHASSASATRSTFRAILTSLFLMCGGCGAPKSESVAHWQVLVTDREGSVYVLTTTPRDLADIVPRYEKKKIEGLVSPCCGAWLDPESGRLATVERRQDGAALAVYAIGSMSLLLEQHLPAGNHSAPTLSRGGTRVAVVDCDRNLLVGSISSGAPSTCELAMNLSDLGTVSASRVMQWLSRDVLIASGSKCTCRVNIVSRECRCLSDTMECLGVVGDSIAFLDTSTREAVFLDADGREQKRTGFIWGSSYSASWVLRISPEGEYVAYDQPLLGGWLGTSLTIQNLKSVRQVHLKDFKFSVWMGSWLLVDDDPTAAHTTGANRKA
jgi:hypothetical protein